MDGKRQLKLLGREDKLFDGSQFPKPFEFNREVAAVFDDMVSRSVPLYQDVTDYAARWAQRFYQEGTVIYDIGCSTGTTLELMSRYLDRPARFVGIDSSAAMLAKAREKLKDMPPQHRVDWRCEDARETAFETCSMVVMNYTMQFIPVIARRPLLEKIFKAMAPGGILFISEKTRGICPEFQETTTAIYEAFKREQGYSESEIARKKEALENVLVPLTEPELRALLEGAGFSFCDSVMKWNNFVSLVALKGFDQ